MPRADIAMVVRPTATYLSAEIRITVLYSGLIDHSLKMTIAAMAKAEKKMWVFVAGMDAPPVLELAEHVFNAAALTIFWWMPCQG